MFAAMFGGWTGQAGDMPALVRMRRPAAAVAARLPAFACWAAALLLLAACGGGTPEQRLRASMDELQTAIQARDAKAVQARLADDFVGPEGLDRDGARRLAAASFLRYRDVWLQIAAVRYEVQGERATVVFEAALGGGSGAALPDAAQLYEVRTGWRERDGEWRMISAEWKPRL
ncbi:ketosteroid isomerase-like protein [Lysobacter enzymogenes]